MKTISRILFFTILILLNSFITGYAQTVKNEVERSIKKSEMPAKATKLIDEFWPNLKRVKYYLETDGALTTYEVKLKWEGADYSIEFSTEGDVLDVEMLIDFESIPETVRNAIIQNLKSQFNSYRFTRVQKQFTAADEDEDEKNDADFIDDILEKDEEDYEIRYEIVLDGENKDELGSFEMLYDNAGNLLIRRKNVRRSIDNIW